MSVSPKSAEVVDLIEKLDREDLERLVRSLLSNGVALSFHGKRTAMEIARRVRPRVMRREPRLHVGSVKEQARNLLVEGENLQAMVTLYKFRGLIDLVLTDPPYNTGQFFRYNDRWDIDPNDPDLGTLVTREDGSRHTKWIKALMPRLQMMKAMLKPSGVLATHKDKAEQYTYDNTNGNLTEKIKWGQVTGSDDGTFSDTGSDKFVIDNSYASSTGSKVTGKPYDETTTDQSASKVSETRHYFDGLSLGSVGNGNETKTETWKSGSSYASTTKTYNSYGLVTQSKDGRGDTTTYVYDSNNLDVATSTNASGQATNYLYNYLVGKPKQVTDPNGLIFQSVYDGVGRVTQEKQPDLTSTTTLVTKNQYTYTDAPLASSIQKTSYLNSASSTNTYTYLDGFGRTIQTRSQAKGNNTYAVKDNIYNTRGLLAQESLPYFASSTTRSSATSTSALYSTYTYDPLSRVTQITNAVGTTSNAYLNWKVTTTDANGKQKDLYKDAFDNLITVVEHIGSGSATTSYAWNGNGYLTSITDASGNLRNFTYDGMGRRLTAEDLHASGDTSFGSWTYAYDDANNQTQTVDPKSQTVNFTYDALNVHR